MFTGWLTSSKWPASATTFCGTWPCMHEILSVYHWLFASLTIMNGEQFALGRLQSQSLLTRQRVPRLEGFFRCRGEMRAFALQLVDISFVRNNAKRFPSIREHGRPGMTFWDSFAHRVFATFLEGNPGGGRRAAAELLEEAYVLGLLDVVGLSLTSLQLCILVCDHGSPLFNAARTQLAATGGSASPGTFTGALAEALLQACPLRTRVLETLAGEFNPHSISAPTLLGWKLIFEGLQRQYLPRVVEFLTRSLLIPYPRARALGEMQFALAYVKFDVGELIRTSGDFVRYIYLCALHRLARRRMPTSWPPAPPAWAALISQSERDFLCCAFGLKDPKCRLLVFLSFYAGLNIDQIAFCLQDANAGWTLRRTEAATKGCWLTVLRCMGRAHKAGSIFSK
jgi:hypothetical protein